jgi:hypothetical protein
MSLPASAKHRRIDWGSGLRFDFLDWRGLAARP